MVPNVLLRRVAVAELQAPLCFSITASSKQIRWFGLGPVQVKSVVFEVFHYPE